MAHDEISLASLLVGVGSFALGLAARSVAPTLVSMIQRATVRLLATRGWNVNLWGRLGGQWNHVWYAQGSIHFPDENNCTTRLFAVGRHAAGLYESGGRMWLVTMSVGGDHLVVGRWQDVEAPGYHGAWMGKISLTGDYVTGW